MLTPIELDGPNMELVAHYQYFGLISSWRMSPKTRTGPVPARAELLHAYGP